jgi:hypothetical protein
MVTASQAASLCCHGCFTLTVQKGAVACRGAIITQEHGTVPISSAPDAPTLFMRAAVTAVDVPLVLSRIATATFTLKGLVQACSVSCSRAELDSQSIEDPVSRLHWDEVRIQHS